MKFWIVRFFYELVILHFSFGYAEKEIVRSKRMMFCQAENELRSFGKDTLWNVVFLFQTCNFLSISCF